MNRMRSRVDLFRYRDYRSFLRDWYADQKQNRASFNFRAFSRRAGFRSPNFLKLVMDGKRNLTEKSMAKFVVGLKLNKQEQEFFRNLVFFNQAAGHEERDGYFRGMLRSGKFRRARPIEKSRYEYYSKWYHPVVRELVTSARYDGTPAWLARRIVPRITKEQAVKSVELLSDMGFIKRGEDGKWKQSTPIVTTGPEVASHVLFTYHLKMLDVAKEMLRTVKASERDVSAMTFAVAKEKIAAIKALIREFRREVFALLIEEKDPDAVLQLNIQMFPVTSSDEDGTE